MSCLKVYVWAKWKSTVGYWTGGTGKSLAALCHQTLLLRADFLNQSVVFYFHHRNSEISESTDWNQAWGGWVGIRKYIIDFGQDHHYGLSTTVPRTLLNLLGFLLLQVKTNCFSQGFNMLKNSWENFKADFLLRGSYCFKRPFCVSRCETHVNQFFKGWLRGY